MHKHFCTLVFSALVFLPCVRGQILENWVRLDNGQSRQIRRIESVVGGFLTVPPGQGLLTVRVENPKYIDLFGNSTVGSYSILARVGDSPHGTYVGGFLRPDSGVISSGGPNTLRIRNPVAGDYFVAAFSNNGDRIVSSYQLTVTYSVVSQPGGSPPPNLSLLLGPILNPANQHSYYLTEQSTWTRAESVAIALGGNLVTVNDATENEWITSTFTAPYFYLWTGLNDVEEEGTFVWSSGTPVTYNNWFPGEPNDFDGGEDYGLIYNFDSGFRQWNDMKDFDTFLGFPIYGLVEVESVEEVLVGARAAELAKSVVGAPYFFGGKGWNGSDYVSAAEIKEDYSFYQAWEMCGARKLEMPLSNGRGAGLDCSGLVMWSFNKAYGSRANRTPVFEGANEQFLFNSHPVSEGDLQPGDLLFFNFGRPDLNASHVAMYVGGASATDVVEAVNCRIGVKRSSKDTLKQLQSFVGFRRVHFVNHETRVRARSPIDLTVTDPDGDTISAETFLLTDSEGLREIPGRLYYWQDGVDSKGFTKDVVSIPQLKAGLYSITLSPKFGARAEDTYSIDIEIGGVTRPIVENIRIDQIPPLGYLLDVTEDDVKAFRLIVLDVKPDTAENSINLKSQGVIPVAVLSTSDFEASTLDLQSLSFAPNGTRPVKAKMEDVNSDGLDDLLLHFVTQDIGLTATDSSVILIGTTVDGEAVRGSDHVRIVPVRK